MTGLFLEILNMSLTASVVILLVLFVRIFLKKAPKIFSYSLWSVVLFRLVCPFSFESILSLLPMKANPIPQDIGYSTIPQIDTGINVIDNAVNPILPPAVQHGGVNSMQIIIFWGTVIWLIGIIALIIYSIASYLRLKHRVSTALVVEGNIYECETVSSPFVLGLLKPKIYLPLGLSNNQREYIIKHEQTHIKRFDTLVKPIAFLVFCIHWFNPLCWLAFVLMSKDMELSCDEAVIKEMGSEIKCDYSISLLSLATSKKMLNGSPLSFGESNVKARIKNVLSYKKPAFWIIAVTIIVVIAVGIGLLSNPKSSDENVGTPVTNKIMASATLENGFDVQLVLIDGRTFSDKQVAIGGGVYPTNFTGKYELQVLKEGKVISTVPNEELLANSFDGISLNFPDEFELNMLDYNNDGSSDFPIGQWGGSKYNSYELYSVYPDGSIKALEVEGGLLVSEQGFSPQFRKVSDTGFEFGRYDNGIGGTLLYTAEWNGVKFDVTQNEVPIPLLPWAQKLSVQDVKSIELIVEPSPVAERYKKYSSNEFTDIVKLINESKGELLPYNEATEGSMQTLYITQNDGQKHTITNGGNTYLIIDGQFYKGDYALLSKWGLKGNEAVPNSFYQGEVPVAAPVKEGEVSPSDFVNEIVASFQIKEGVARFIIPNRMPSGYELSQLSIYVRGSMPMGNDSNMSLHAFEQADIDKKWQLGQEYIERILDVDVPDGTEVYIHAALMEKDNTTSIYYGGNTKVFPLREDTYTPNVKTTATTVTFTNKFNDTLKLTLSLPTGFTMRAPATGDAIEFNQQSVEIYKGTTLVGTIHYNDFDLYRDENGDIPYMSVYNSIMLGSMASWDNEYTEISKTKDTCTATCKPWHRIDIPGVSGAAQENAIDKGILAYDANLLKYVAIYLDDQAVTQLQLEEIAKSVKLSS